ncbi:hypothetical protein Mapa_001908 [Marchantia paleacea]|nr:hypothetical protein Mapa_001908 [Marchantia paleacea]
MFKHQTGDLQSLNFTHKSQNKLTRGTAQVCTAHNATIRDLRWSASLWLWIRCCPTSWLMASPYL